MRFIIPVILVLFFSSCKESALRKSFSSADSLVIHFKDEQAGQVLKTVQTAEHKAISRMIDFIEAPETVEYKCGYDGKMFFYQKGQQIQEVDFRAKIDSCRHFSFMFEGKIMNTRMNQEAADFMDALERGLPTYY